MNFRTVNYTFFLIAFIFFLTACNSDTNKPQETTSKDISDNSLVVSTNINKPAPNFNYNIDSPSSIMELTKKLKEISGLVAYEDKWLLAVQDEKGVIYYLDKDSGKILDSTKFASKGDFEGITRVGTTVYVMRSDGILFQVDNWENQKEVEGKMISTGLSIANNVEGLDYDPVNNSLLIACKGSAAIGKELHSERSIFSYDLKTAQLNPTPVLSISIDKIKKYAQEHIASDPNLEVYLKGMEKKDKSITIAPSAIAVHPINKNFYILSSVGKSLLVMNRANEIIYMERLPKKEFEQPEGITFSSNGDMYISSEGQKEQAKLYKFDYIPN